MAIEFHRPIVKTLAWPDEKHTRDFARALALRVQAGGPDLSASITLEGAMGAGKTTLVRHLLQALGVAGRIKSPTYAVVEPYSVNAGGAEPLAIWHFDFYRFNDPQEWEDAGFRDIFAGPGLKLMEWPDKVEGQLPPPDWVIALDAIDEDKRHVRISAGTSRGQHWLQTWATAHPEASHAR
jgi:tRNA threonylcarbamoyladenosine biosynthesis protein TsaE